MTLTSNNSRHGGCWGSYRAKSCRALQRNWADEFEDAADLACKQFCEEAIAATAREYRAA
jgi:hypothetical protein